MFFYATKEVIEMTQTGIPGIFGGYTPRKTIPSNQVQNQSWYSWGSPAGVQKQPQTTPTTATTNLTESAPIPTSGGGHSAYPEFSVDLAGIWASAGAMADNEINPQLAEIDRLLVEAGYTAEESQRAIAEAYPIARRSIQKSIYENMVAGEGNLAAMGTGRGGGRQELTARAGERESTGIESLENSRTRETGAINRALANYQGQMGTQRANLVGSRGRLQAGYAEQLRGNRFNEAATMHGFDMQRAQLEEQARQFNTSMANRGNAAGTGSVFDLGGGGGSYYSLSPEDISENFGVDLPVLASKYSGTSYDPKNLKKWQIQSGRRY